MVLPLRPRRGGFLRPFGCGWFIREFLLGNAPFGSPSIDPQTGAPQADIFHHYKMARLEFTAMERATRQEERQAKRQKRAISPDNIEKIAEQRVKRIPWKSNGCPTALSPTSLTCTGWAGWKRAASKSIPASRITIPKVSHVGSTALLVPAWLPLKAPGLTPMVLFTVDSLSRL